MEDVNLTFKVLWRFKDYHHLKITKDKRIIDCKKSKILAYNKRGFFIDGNYYKRNDLKRMIEKIPEKEYCPFSNGTIKI
jgi:hypothetical protein